FHQMRAELLVHARVRPFVEQIEVVVRDRGRVGPGRHADRLLWSMSSSRALITRSFENSSNVRAALRRQFGCTSPVVPGTFCGRTSPHRSSSETITIGAAPDASFNRLGRSGSSPHSAKVAVSCVLRDASASGGGGSSGANWKTCDRRKPCLRIVVR